MSAAFDGGADFLLSPRHGEAALRRHFLPVLGNHAGTVGFEFTGDGEDLFAKREFKVEAGVDALAEQPHIGVLDMATVLAKVHRDAVSPRLFAGQGGLERLGLESATGLTQGGDVVDIHSEKNGHGELRFQNIL